ncbi:sodium-dependent transporter [Bacteroidota bacterium]
MNPGKRDNFGSKLGILAAAAGSAIGLGNIWRFPYETGENGGGAFLVVYLVFIFALGVPLMLSEFIIGRRAQRNPIGTFKKLAPGKPWHIVGLMGVAAAFMIFAFYGVVAGWTLEYIFQAVKNGFGGKDATEITAMFEGFTQSSFKPIMWQIIFMAMTAGIIMAGVKKGIEKYAKILMPVLLVIIIILCVRSVTLPGAEKGLAFLFKPDFSKINGDVILSALGQAFFSLSLGMGTMITYGSYISKKDNLPNTAIQVSIIDTLIAILAGVAIFPAVFAFGIDPAAGEGLIFITLPNIFQQMPGGYIFALLFFVLIGVAALTSTISLLEVIVAYFTEELKISRKKATVLSATGILFLGVLCSLSRGEIEGFTIFGLNIFSLFDYISANLLLPIGGLCIVVFVGWQLKKKDIYDEFSSGGTFKARFFPAYMFIVKFIAPIAIAIVFLNAIGLINLSS